MAGEVEEGLSPSVPRGTPTGRLDPVGTGGVEGMGTGHSIALPLRAIAACRAYAIVIPFPLTAG